MVRKSSWEHLVGVAKPVLDHGHVILLDFMGSDESIVEAARVSVGSGARVSRDNRSLIRYLVRNGHHTPLETCVLKFHVKLPIFVERQWARHRTASWVELSGRYAEARPNFYQVPLNRWNLQPDGKSYCGDEVLNPEIATQLKDEQNYIQGNLYNVYKNRLDNGVVREVARVDLPLSMYTEKVWVQDLSNLLHFLELRLDEHAQKEIREYANEIAALVELLFPLTWEAFVDFRLNAVKLTRLDSLMIKYFTQARKMSNSSDEVVFNTCCQLDQPFVAAEWGRNSSERKECFEKLKRLGLITNNEEIDKEAKEDI